MTLKKWTKWKWAGLAAAVVVVAVAAGIATAVFNSNGLLAQDKGPRSYEQPSTIVDTSIPSSMINEVQVEVVQESIPFEPMESATGAGTSTRPTSGNFFYLPMIDRYYVLPSDVTLVERIDFGTCDLFAPSCPVTPSYVFQKGSARVSIDSVGHVSGLDEGDAEAFSFFLEAEEDDE